MEEETSEGSEYSEETTSASESSSQSSSEADSSIEVCGVTLGNIREDGERSQNQLKDEDLEKMIVKDLSLAKKEGFKTMLRKHSSLFIFDYCEITGVMAVQHQINLKPNQKPVAQKLRQLGRIQQEALLMKVRKLTKAGFICGGF